MFFLHLKRYRKESETVEAGFIKPNESDMIDRIISYDLKDSEGHANPFYIFSTCTLVR